MSDDEAPGQELTNIRYLPGAEPGDTVEPVEVVDGEVITDEEYLQLTEPARAVARWRAYGQDVVVVGRAAAAAARHDWTRTVARVIARNVLYVPGGIYVVGRRIWNAASLGRYERVMAMAEATGDLATLGDWEERSRQAKRERHQRFMDWLEWPVRFAKAVGIGIGTLFGVLLLLGIMLAWGDDSDYGALDPIIAVFSFVKWVAVVVTAAWGPFVLVSPYLALLVFWHIGRRQGAVPRWVATTAGDVDLPIDETTIAQALDALRIPQITAYLKKGLPLQYLTPVRQEGRGTGAEFRLPAGVPADMIARRRAALATGLHRLAKEVWPTTGGEEGIVKLWVANKGALAEGAGPYPLLAEGFTDVFKGVPFGKTLRGDPVMIPLMGRNTIVGGQPGQGKSSAARVTLLGASLDITAELRIWVPDANFDFEVFRPRCSRYVMGAENEKIEQILLDLRELHEEVQHRGELLIRHQEPEVTRRLASAGVGLHPLFCLLEEAHVAFNHKAYGEEISEKYVEIVRLGRKRGIHMIPSTQAPTKTSIPRDVTRNCTNGIAFAVQDHVANDALLGQGAYAGGHRATELIPGTDIGTCVAKGLTGERSDIVQVYFVSVAKGNDQATPIIQRSLAAIAERGQGLPGSDARRRPSVVEQRDLLEDLAEVLGDEVIPSSKAPALLARLAPQWRPYQSLTGRELREQLLDEYGIRVPSTGNRWPLDPAVIRAELAKRRVE